MKAQKAKKIAPNILILLTVLAAVVPQIHAAVSQNSKTVYLLPGDKSVIHMDDLWQEVEGYTALEDRYGAWTPTTYKSNDTNVEISGNMDPIKTPYYFSTGFDNTQYISANTFKTNITGLKENCTVLTILKANTIEAWEVTPSGQFVYQSDRRVYFDGVASQAFVTTDSAKQTTTFVVPYLSRNAGYENDLFILYYPFVSGAQKYTSNQTLSVPKPSVWQQRPRLFVGGYETDIFVFERQLGHVTNAGLLPSSTTVVYASLMKGVPSVEFDVKAALNLQKAVYLYRIDVLPGNLMVAVTTDSLLQVTATQAKYTIDATKKTISVSGVTKIDLSNDPLLKKAFIERVAFDNTQAVFVADVAATRGGNIIVCAYDPTKAMVSGCKSTNPKGKNPLRFRLGYSVDAIHFNNGRARIEYYNLVNLKAGIWKGVAVYYNIQPGSTTVSYLTQTDGNARTAAVAAFVPQPSSVSETDEGLRQHTGTKQYSYLIGETAIKTYTNTITDYYCVIDVSTYTSAYPVEITRTKSGTATTKLIYVNKLAGLNDNIQVLALPNIDIYNNTQQELFKIGREHFIGNNLEFKLSDRNFKIINLNGLTLDLTSVEFGDTHRFVSENYGITYNATDLTVIRAFSCKFENPVNHRKCSILPGVVYTVAQGSTLKYVSLNDFEPEEGIVFAVGQKNQTTFVYFGVQYPDSPEVFPVTIGQANFIALDPSAAFFKITSKKETFWIIKKQLITGHDYIDLYSAYNKELTAMPSDNMGKVYTSAQVNLSISDGIQFCPVSVHKNPLEDDLVDVLSICTYTKTTYLFTFNTQDIEDINLAYARNLHNYGNISKACNLGTEILLLTETGTVMGVNYKNDESMSVIDTAAVGYKTITDLWCVRGKDYAVIQGTQTAAPTNNQMSVLMGNRQGDQRNRWFTTLPIANSYVFDLSPTSDGLIVTVATKGTNGADSLNYVAITTTGPHISYGYMKAKPTGDLTLTLDLSGTGGKTATGTIKYSRQNYTGKISLDKPKMPMAGVGSYDLGTLGTITGPILSIDSAGDEFTNITISSPVYEDISYNEQLSAMRNLPEPDAIVHSETTYAVGYRTSITSTMLYYYNNTDQYIGIEDTGFRATNPWAVAIAHYEAQNYTLAVLATVEGGESHLRWFTKSFNTNGGSSFGYIKENFKARSVSVSFWAENIFLVVAIEQDTNVAYAFQVTVMQNGPKDNYVQFITQLLTLSNGNHHK